MGKILNFDQFIREAEKQTMEIIVKGDKYVIPMEIPAIVPVMMARAEEKMSPAESTRMVMRAADALFGVEGVNKMCSKGLAAKDIATLVEQVFSAISGTDEDEDDDVQELDDEDGHVQTGKNKAAKK